MSDFSNEKNWPFGIAPNVYAKLTSVFENTPGLAKVWVYGSRGRGSQRRESDIDLAVEWQDIEPRARLRLLDDIDKLGLIYRTDLIDLSEKIAEDFRARIEKDRKIFWQPRRHSAEIEELGSIQLKPFQTRVLSQLDRYLNELKKHAAQSETAVNALRAMEGMEDVAREAADFPKKTWNALKSAHALPPAFAEQPYSSRFDGAGRAIPNVCLKIPTGGGKTLLAAAAVGRVFSNYRAKHTGLVLWIVPNEAIYKQTLKTLADRDHPYRQMLNVAGAGRVKILEKDSPLTRMDVESHLCVMLLMLQSAARKDEAQKKLKAFRDRGNVLGFTPREDDIEAHWALLDKLPNLDVYAPFGMADEMARKTKGSIIKSSLGNVLRLVRPMIVMDEGHHAYTENALRTLDGFNPCFLIELSATPRISNALTPSPSPARRGEQKSSGSNILVDVRGTDLDEAEMIKLPINVDVRAWQDWQSCLATTVAKLDDLQREAEQLHAENNRYIRPILLVQVERTGKELLDAGMIHAEHAKAYLMQLGFAERQIAIKTSDKDDLKQPENIDLLSPTCEIRAIITKQALQEGWDCPFAYVLCALAAGKAVGAMTQLMGRILRQPQVAKTGRENLDSCYVYCYQAQTAKVVSAIKTSLETEGMGDLALAVHGDSPDANKQHITFKRREKFASLQLFLPRVTKVEGDKRRPLEYDSDVLAHVDWGLLDVRKLAQDWAPSAQNSGAQQFRLGLEVLQDVIEIPAEIIAESGKTALDKAKLVRGLLDIVPNPWWVWAWVDAVVEKFIRLGYAQRLIAASSASLLERLRVDIEAERDQLAQAVFNQQVTIGNIEFSLKADATDYQIPHEFALEISGKPQPMMRDDAKLIEKSLFEPAINQLTDTGLERDVACYLDEQAALVWWHRNVAKSQYGLQGWKRNRIYPDFVFARIEQNGNTKLVVLETKGLHLAGSDDTAYKQSLLQKLSDIYQDKRRLGSLELEVTDQYLLQCDLVFGEAWQGSMDARHFNLAET